MSSKVDVSRAGGELVKVGSLSPGTVFLTSLTNRIGIVLDKGVEEVEVELSPLGGASAPPSLGQIHNGVLVHPLVGESISVS